MLNAENLNNNYLSFDFQVALYFVIDLGFCRSILISVHYGKTCNT